MEEVSQSKPGYLIQVSKQHRGLEEIVQITTNMPVGTTREELGAELKKIGLAMDDRIRALNSEVLARTGKNLADLELVRPELINLKEEK